MSALIKSFIAFVHEANCDRGPLASCWHPFCRWAAQTPNPQTPKRLTMARIIMDGWRDDNTPQTQTGRICGEMVIGEGGESAGICDKPYGHAGKHPTMPYDEYKRRLSQTPNPQTGPKE